MRTSNITIHAEKPDDIWQKAVAVLLERLKLYQRIGQPTLLLLSGGSAVNLYYRLAEFVNSADSDFLAFAQVDERFQPRKVSGIKYQVLGIDKDEINACQIERIGLWKACQRRTIPYHLVPQIGNLQDASRKYDKTISKLFKKYIYKIVVLGIGEDGHTAGLLPGYESVWNVKKLVVGYENDSHVRQRITLTPKAITQVDYAIIGAVGEKKRKEIVNILKTDSWVDFNTYPASLIQKIPKVDLFTDFTFK